jgi:hypothetical protein
LYLSAQWSVQRFPPAAKLPGAIDAGPVSIAIPKIPRRRIDFMNRVILIASSFGDEAKPWLARIQ